LWSIALLFLVPQKGWGASEWQRQGEPALVRMGQIEEAGVMVSLMLVCAVAASLAFGVLVAYGVCQVMFRVFRVHAEAVAKERVVGASVRVA